MRDAIIVGNWKMYKAGSESTSYLDALIPLVAGAKRQILLAVPFTAIRACSEKVKGSAIQVGAQNMHDAREGAFTGEVAASMLIDAGADFVLLGHSERRHVFGESSEFVNRKVKRALQAGIRPIVCVGETLEEREAELAESTLDEQLSASLEGLSEEEVKQVTLAYEPVWAIGTGRTATPQAAEAIHLYLRSCLNEKWGDEVARRISILYGGSVKPENAHELLEAEDVDGLLVGGASLSAESFSKIVKA